MRLVFIVIQRETYFLKRAQIVSTEAQLTLILRKDRKLQDSRLMELKL